MWRMSDGQALIFVATVWRHGRAATGVIVGGGVAPPREHQIIQPVVQSVAAKPPGGFRSRVRHSRVTFRNRQNVRSAPP
jgi:hypothetical protein